MLTSFFLTKPSSRLACTLLCTLAAFGPTLSLAQRPIGIDARTNATAPSPVRAALGTSTRPDDQTLTVNSQYLVLDGKPWLPVMGEFHYSRVPRQDWEAEILKMKAGGVQIISTYIIWLHHEEVEGQFDWSDRRDLHAFVALCAKHGMWVYPRIGPWAHGEARNGGLPDWVLAKSKTRRNDPVYLAEVKRLYDQVGQQLRGQLWKDGGPVIGIQLENEYRGDSSPGTGDDHIRALKKIAVDAGMDVPLYTVTGWDGAAIPLDAVLPVYGGYPDAPWGASPVKLPPNEVYAFRSTNRVGGNMGIIGGGGQNPSSAYAGTPFLTAEVGGGMQDTYFRRPVVSADDIAAMPTVLVGSGANLLGFYMFQGGRNPEGKLTSLQESQETGYPTDVPLKSYDFQAPLGEFGGERASFRRLKLMNYFLNDFGEVLAPMRPAFPAVLPSSPADLSVPRLAARSAGDHAFVFLNNHVRGTSMKERKHFSVALQLPGGLVTVPAKPIDLPPDAYGIWPVNLELGGGLTLEYSTAQLFHRFVLHGETYFCFFGIPGVAPELALNTEAKPARVDTSISVRAEGGRTYLEGHDLAQPREAVLTTHAGNVHLLLFSRDQAENLWKLPGQSTPWITAAQFYADEHEATLASDGDATITFSQLKGARQPTASVPLKRSSASRLLETYTASLKPIMPKATLTLLTPGDIRDPLENGPVFNWRKQPVPKAPNEAEFRKAAAWTLQLPQVRAPGVSDLRLFVRYNGDVARLSEGQKLVDDDFWNGKPWELSLRDLRDEGVGAAATLQVLPWPANPPMYLEAPIPTLASSGQPPPQTPQVDLVPRYEIKLRLAP